MPEFVYKVKDDGGNIITGTTSEESRKKAILALTQKGYSLISLQEPKPVGKKNFSFGFTEINQEEISIFTRQLSSLLRAGLPIMESLSLLSRKISRERFRERLEDIVNRIKKGESYSSALESHPDIFSQLYIHMVRAGEAAGALEKVLDRLAKIIDRNIELKRKITSAMIYPSTILFVGIGTIIFLVIYVIPKFALIFTDMEQALPLPTALILGISAFLRNSWCVLLGAMFIFGIAMKYFASSEFGRNFLDKLKLKIPIVGPVIEKGIVSSFSRILGTLIASGIPVLQSLDIAGEMIANSVFSREITRLKNSITKGQRLGIALQESNVFPDIVSSLISVGEEAGTLEAVLREISEIYEREVEERLRKMIIFIEPAMIVCMAFFVGFIVIAMLLPLFKMGALLH